MHTQLDSTHGLHSMLSTAGCSQPRPGASTPQANSASCQPTRVMLCGADCVQSLTCLRVTVQPMRRPCCAAVLCFAGCAGTPRYNGVAACAAQGCRCCHTSWCHICASAAQHNAAHPAGATGPGRGCHTGGWYNHPDGRHPTRQQQQTTAQETVQQ